MARLNLLRFLFLFISIISVASAQETFRDEFSAVSYSNNDGTQNFSGAWQENNETTSPSNGQIRVVGNQLRFQQLTGQFIIRDLNLAGATSATITFAYDGSGIGDEVLSLILRRNDGALLIAQNYGNGVGTATFNLPAAFIHSNSGIGFFGNGWDAGETAFVDNVQVSVNFSPPSINVEDITVNEAAGTATFTATHFGANAPGPFTVNYLTNDGSASAGNDFILTSGTLNFNGLRGDLQTFTVPIINDTDFENSETFTVQFTSTSDSAVDISDTATGTINDDDVLEDVPLALFDNFNGNFEYAVAGGTLRTQANSNDNNTACTITDISSGNLTTTVDPAGKTVTKAYLYWAHSNFNLDQDVTLEGSNISADLVYGANFGGLQFYGYVADVTDVVAGIANPWTETYDFSDLSVDNGGGYCASTVVLGAWSLMIFYEDLTLPSSTINLYYGFDVNQNSGTSFTLDNFFAISSAGSKATFLSYEGDEALDGTSGTNNEELSIQSGSAITPSILSGDGSQTGNNPFNSTLYDETSGTNITTTYGLDLDTYDISSFIGASDTQVTANVDAGQDLIISSAVVLRVPSNLISGVVFEDINYPGGIGRNELNSSGNGIPGATIELYNSLGQLQSTQTTDANGEYNFGGMPDGSYVVRVVNSSVRSTRGGGSACTTCYAVQTYRSSYDGISIDEVTDEVGGANPSNEDVAAGSLTGAQTISTVSVFGGGSGNIDFGFNFNTIVNTNEDGQGSLEQFIVNSNGLDEIDLDIGANSIFDPAPGVDTSIFMIPPTGDTQGRAADTNFVNGYFDIFVPNANPFSNITDANTSIDGRTQTAYSGDTNTGTIGSGGTTVGTSGITLPNYNLPEIQIHRNGGDVIKVNADSTVLRNVIIYANNNAAVRLNSGSAIVSDNILGINGQGNNAGDIDFGVEVVGGTGIIDSNYISTNTDAGILINGGASSIIQNNHITANGNSACFDNIRLQSGSGIVIQQNLIENAAALGIDGDGIVGNVTISENTITTSGQNGGVCSGNIENAGVKLDGDNSTITNNIIFSNGGAGLVLAGGNTSGNLISQNSFYANGTTTPSLGIDLDVSNGIGDGVTLNDSGDIDAGVNNLTNFPILESTNINSTAITITGWARPGAIIEFFLTDISQSTASLGDNQLGLSTDYGEGQVFIASFVEGSTNDTNTNTSSYTDGDNNTDNTNKFTFTFNIPSGVGIGNNLTATATVANSTSEFSPFSKILSYTVITNRRITYRVRKN